ncbi:hypothetical protein HanRHA438_Chr09g0386051 [Helianthus annuus]|nr:hypothetical protein HanIR_Chr09g0403531 [Helianthus annuus]KAJ0887023.1 hypothetical protein HanRHA438_Chr09g0386051 [Helianthus annuus]
MAQINQLGLTETTAINQDLDNIIGTNNRIPRLISGGSFSKWKFRFIQYMRIKDPKAWRSIYNAPTVITYIVNDAEGTTAAKPESQFTEEGREKHDIDVKALAMLHFALALEIDIGVRDCKTAKEMWEALLAMYEGNEEMKESRREMLTQRFNLFNHFPGELWKVKSKDLLPWSVI